MCDIIFIRAHDRFVSGFRPKNRRAYPQTPCGKECPLEQIYTIPVNEAFDRVRAEKALGCPFCLLFRKLEEDELDIILGASMMEPDIRKKTNDLGFCPTHYRKMLGRRRRLGMGLILESHLAEVKKKMRSLPSLLALEQDCYVCARIEKNLSAMIATAVYLFETNPAFREKYEEQPFFCLPHYRAMTDYAKKKCPRRVFSAFSEATDNIEVAYLEKLSGDVSWFCKKFDYRYDEEPWYDAKDAIERAIRFLSSDNGDIPRADGVGDTDSRK